MRAGDTVNMQIAPEKSGTTIKGQCFCDIHLVLNLS